MENSEGIGGGSWPLGGGGVGGDGGGSDVVDTQREGGTVGVGVSEPSVGVGVSGLVTEGSVGWGSGSWWGVPVPSPLQSLDVGQGLGSEQQQVSEQEGQNTLFLFPNTQQEQEQGARMFIPPGPGDNPFFTSEEKACCYRQVVEGGIEDAVFKMVEQVIGGEKPFLIQTKPNLGKDKEEQERENWKSSLVAKLWPWPIYSWTTKSGKQCLQRLPPDYQYIRFGLKNNKKFVLMMHLMAKIYGLIINGKWVTIRDLYYDDPALYGSQLMVEHRLYDMCHLLKVPREALRVEATSKGLMAGDLAFKTRFGDVINVNHFPSGMLIPSVRWLDEIYDIKSEARQIIVVEKDAVFQRLLGEQIFDELGPTILITGKGYPDLVTSKMLRKLRDTLKIPVFALVDADPWGIDIASVIRWGSLKQTSIAKCVQDPTLLDELTVPDLVWLGLLPSEIRNINKNAELPLKLPDKRKLKRLKERIAQKGEQRWIAEIERMQNDKRKAELEAVFVHPKFASFYMKNKIESFFQTSQLCSTGPPVEY